MSPYHHDPDTALTRPPMNDLPDIACRGEDPNLFFPDDRADPTPAIRICRRCPHERLCLDWALDTDQRWGIYGATTPGQRARILTDRAKETR